MRDALLIYPYILYTFLHMHFTRISLCVLDSRGIRVAFVGLIFNYLRMHFLALPAKAHDFYT